MRPTQVTFALLGIPGMGAAVLLYAGCALPRWLPNWVVWLLILLAFPVGWFAWTTYPDAAWFLRAGKDRRYHDVYLALCVLWLLAFFPATHP